MSYEAYDNDRFLGQAGTNSGWDDALTYIEIHGGSELQFLAENGYSNDAARIEQEIDLLLKQPIPSYVRSTLLNLRSLARKSTGNITIVH